MVELKERAQQKILSIQKVNRDKSQAKIKQMTMEHQQQGKRSKSQQAKSKQLEDGLGMNKQDANMFDGMDEEDTSKRQNLKRTQDQTGKDKKHVYVNKGKVEQSKLESKKAYKEAKKRAKLNKQKGIVKENGLEEKKATAKA